MAGSGSTLLDLMEVQVGKQTNYTTPLAAPTAKLMGVSTLVMPSGVTGMVHHDRRGSLAPGYLATLTEIMPDGISMEQLGLYEDCCYILDNLCGEASPSGVGPYTRDYAAPLGTAPTPRILTLVYGDDTNCYALNGALVKRVTVTGATGAPQRWAIEFMGRDIASDSLAALSDRTVNVIMGDHTQIYIDAWGGTIGTTEIAATAYAYELVIDSKRKGDMYLGSLLTQSYHEDDGAEGWDGTLKLSLEFNAASKTQYDALISQSTLYQRQIRIKSTSGTNVLQFDFAGSSEQSPDYGADRDGVLTFEVTLRGTYNTSLGNWFKAQSINGVSALP